MEYNEVYFKKSANKKALAIWLVLCVALTVINAIDVVRGDHGVPYFIAYMVFCWLPFFIGLLMLKLKGFDYSHYKDKTSQAKKAPSGMWHPQDCGI